MNRPPQQFNLKQLQLLQQYDWPGNVRELRNVVEQAAIYANAGPLRVQLPEISQDSKLTLTDKQLGSANRNDFVLPHDILTEKEMQLLQKNNTYQALEHCNWKIYGDDGAAALLGIKPTTLATRIKKMQLKQPTS